MKDNSSQQTRSAIQNQLQRRRDSVDLEKKKKPAGIIEALSRQGPIKKAFRHWRSPSNPLDWSRSAWSVNTALIGADEEEASQPTITKETRNYSTMCMTKNYQDNDDILSVIGSPPVYTLNIQNSADLKAYYLPTRHRRTPSPLGLYNFTAQELLSLFEEEEEETSRMTFIEEQRSERLKSEHSSTPIPRGKSPLIKVSSEQRRSHSWRLSYELTLMKCPSLASQGGEKFPLLAEMTVSPIVSAVASDFSSTRRFAFAFEGSYCGQRDDCDNFAATSLGFGRIDPLFSDLIFARNAQRFAHRANLSLTSASQATQKLAFSRASLLQVILKNPEDGAVADIFVIRLDLSDMPSNSRTILRQKVYRTPEHREEGEPKSFNSTNQSYLAKEIEIPLIRNYDPESKRQRIKLSGPITVAFSFNRSNLRFPGKANASGVERAQKTTTLLQFPLEKKYFSLQTMPTSLDSLKRTSSLTSSDRSSQHGSLCL